MNDEFKVRAAELIEVGRYIYSGVSLPLFLLLLGMPFSALTDPGDLDPTFGPDGRVLTDLGGGDGASALVVQPDGKVVAAGGSTVNFALARYHPDGSLDNSFGNAGVVLTDFGAPSRAQALVLQSDAKLVAAGATGDSHDFALVRYNPDGSRDSSFGNGGLVVTDLGGGTDDAGALALVLQPDGKLVAAGAAAENFLLARYHPDGSLDSGFGNGGVVLTDFGATSGAETLVLQPDAKLVAAGRISFLGTRDFGLARYNADGSLGYQFRWRWARVDRLRRSCSGLASTTRREVGGSGGIIYRFCPGAVQPEWEPRYRIR